MITSQEWDSFQFRLDNFIKEFSESLLWNNLSDEDFTIDSARNFVLQFGLFTRHSRQCWANVVGNTPVLEVRRFIVAENLWEEEANEETAHYKLMVQMGKALGLDEKVIDEAVPTYPTGVAFLAWETLTKTRPWLEGLCAKSVLERLNNKDLGNLSAVQAERWMSAFDLSRADVEFFLLHAEVDQLHGDGTLEIIREHARNTQDLEDALTAAQSSLNAWRVMFDGIVTVRSP